MRTRRDIHGHYRIIADADVEPPPPLPLPAEYNRIHGYCSNCGHSPFTPSASSFTIRVMESAATPRTAPVAKPALLSLSLSLSLSLTAALLLVHKLSCVPCTTALKWTHGALSGCTYNFKQSPRERFKNEQHDPLVVWLGSPSTALQVRAKFGLLPIPTVWSSYANVLYCHCPTAATQWPHQATQHAHVSTSAANASTIYVETVRSFLDNWCGMSDFGDFCTRSLYLAGNYLDKSGGQHLLQLAVALEATKHGADANSLNRKSFDLRGVAVGFAPFTPTAVFVRHKAFESSNGLNFWTVDRASKPVSCNAKMNNVEFWMHDVRLTYSLSVNAQTEAGREVYEYELCSVSTWDTCYRNISAFADYFVSKLKIPYEELFAALSSPADPERVFPSCDCSNQRPAVVNQVQHQIERLLATNVSVLMYNTIRKSHAAICSFYIGIFTNDALRIDVLPATWTDHVNSAHAVEGFNAAALEEMPPSWTVTTGAATGTDSTIPGMIQRHQVGIHMSSTGTTADLTWMQFDAAAEKPVRAGTVGKDSYAVLSRSGALDVLFNLLHKESEVDFIELYVMDHIEGA
jgi:hypothetical protein